jgi:hypothetical protein
MAKPTLDRLFSFEPYRPLACPKRDEQFHMDLASLPTCSGDECAGALERCGMLRFDQGCGVVWMECGATFVAVPACNAVPIETLADILVKSGLSPKAFLGQLQIQ